MQLRCKCRFTLFLMTLVYTAFAQDQLSILTGDIKSGPSVYYSSDAYSYFTENQQNLPPQADKETVFKSYRAIMAISGLGTKAIAAAPVILDIFPVAYHVSKVKNVQYTGEGSFDDWVHTYITSERNKFLLASPFLDYNSMSICESHIEVSHEIEYLDKVNSRGKLNITIIFKLNIGACGLEKITGMLLGDDISAWRKWWEEQGSSQLSSTETVTPVISGPALSSGQAFSEIVKKGKYRISLSTGDELIGIVESKDDTSLIIETTEGKPYSVGHRLIKRYELLTLPPPSRKNEEETAKNKEIKERESVSYDQLKNKLNFQGIVEVMITNGSIFKGKLISVDESMLTLNIEGSHIPIAKGVISQITLINQQQNTAEQQKNSMHKGPLDTIFVRNPETDEYGKPKNDLIFSGSITFMDNKKVSLDLPEGGKKDIERVEITRIIRHSSSGYDESIKRYAKPLFCPDDMFLVDVPPGKQGRPFLKVCIDRYEYPNRKDVIPQGNISYGDAQKYCEQQGKRLCTQDEWQWACSGLEGYSYPYGWNRDDIKCNTDSKITERSGSRHNCVSKFGGYDMVGNIFEWVTGTKNEPMLMGGPYSKCQTVSPGVGGGAKPQTGFRCCKSN